MVYNSDDIDLTRRIADTSPAPVETSAGVTVQDALKGALDSLLFASAELKAQAHIPLEDAELIQNRIDQIRSALHALSEDRT
jgi:hypothetical protein